MRLSVIDSRRKGVKLKDDKDRKKPLRWWQAEVKVWKLTFGWRDVLFLAIVAVFLYAYAVDVARFGRLTD